MLGGIIVLYRDAFKESGGAFARSAMIWPLPVGILFVLQVGGALLAPLGIIGGLVHFVLSSYLYGAYLYLVGEALSRRAPMTVQDIKESFGHHMREVMNLLFLFWILGLALSMGVSNGQITSTVAFVIMMSVAVLFNPCPEIIHQDRNVGGMEILAKSFRWMSENGPEWVPNLVLTAVVFFVLMELTGVLLGVLICGALIHPWMLFRGALYRGIGGSSRRSRDWQSRF